MANGQIRGEDIVQESVFQVFTRLSGVVEEQIKQINALEAATRAALGGQGIAKNANEAAEAVRKSNGALTEQEKVYREINRLKERNSQVSRESLAQLAEERTKRTQLNRQLKDEATVTSALSSAYQKLRKQRDLAGNTLRDLVASEKASNKELRNAQKEFDRLNGKVKKADRAIGNFRDNVGNYGSAVQGVVGFSRELLSAFGVFSAIQVGQEIFEQIKALDALRFGLELVTESQEAFNAAQFFLDELADRAGADLLVLTDRYTNFLAAAKSTTLTLAQTQEIFENVVVAGAALGRSTDDVNGSLRALEQILSKGNVQAEEIRGQLGERLPGAFQILEKALGLATGELNELLEVGGLLSVEAIPALSKGLEEAFSLDTIDRVENLVAAQQRLTNEFNIFIRGLGESNGVISRTLKGLFDGLTAVVTLLQQVNGQDVLDAAASGQARGYAVAIEAVASEAERLNITLSEAAERILPRFNNILEENGAILQDVTSGQSQSAVQNFFNMLTGKFDEQQETAAAATGKLNLYRKAIEALKEIIATGKLPEDLQGVTDKAEENANTLESLRAKLKVLRDEFEKTDVDTPRFGQLRGEISDLEELIKRLTGRYKENKKALEDIVDFDSIKFVEDLARGIESLRDRTEVGSAAWVQYGKDLEGVNRRIQELSDTANVLDGDLSSLELPDLGDGDLESELTDFLNTQGLDTLLADLARRAGESKEDVIEQFEALYGRDFEKFKEFEERKSRIAKEEDEVRFEIRERALDLADALQQSFTEIQLRRLDEEEARQNAIFDNVVNNKESSEEAIKQAEEDRLKSEERIAKKRAEAEQKAFLFTQALAVAEIFIADSLARANAAIAASAAAASAALLGPAAAFKASIAVLGTLNSLISTSTAIALATVAAQSLPQFFYKGKGVGDNYEGPAIWGELRKEVKLSKDGQIEVSPDGASPTYVKSSDIILKSLGEFSSKLGVSNSEVSQRVRKGIQRTSDNSLHTIMTRDSRGKTDPDLERILERAVAKGLSRARLSPKFNIYNDSRVRRVP